MIVVDVSNASSPVRAGNVTFSSGEDFGLSVTILGRYAYLVTVTNPVRLIVADVSDPSNPVRVGNVTLAPGENSGSALAVSGRYAYLTTQTSPVRLVVVSLPGIEVPTAEIGSLETGKLSVAQSMQVGGNLVAGTSMTIGSGGLLVQGDMATRDLRVLGNFTTTNLSAAQICINGDCKSSWSSGGGGGNVTVVTGAVTNTIPYFVNATTLDDTTMFWDNTNQRLGINAITPQATLDVNGSIQSLLNGTTLRSVGNVTLASGDDLPRAVAVSGKYAYIGTETFPGRLAVVDVSNPSSPARVGGLTLATDENNTMAVAVAGRYAYLTTSTYPARFVTVDVSNPSTPTRIGNLTFESGEDRAFSLALAGRYAYATTFTTPGSLIVVDTADPANPRRVGNITFASGEDQPRTVVMQGQYAYVSLQTSPARLVIIDVTNATRPIRVGNVTLATGENNAYSVSVRGRYAYLVTYTSPSQLVVVDISNVTNPVRVGNVTLPSGEDLSRSHVLAGRYAYLTTQVDPARLVVVDINNPANPVRVGNLTLATDENRSYFLTAAGRYVYHATYTSPSRLVAVELPGIETATGSIGSLEAGTLSVQTNANVQQNLQVGGGMTLGAGGGLIQGAAAFMNLQVNNSFEVRDRFFINNSNNRIDIGSAARNVTVSVNGTVNATGSITQNSGFDLAEAFAIEEYVEAGDLVISETGWTVSKATQDKAHIVVGAVSTNPGFILDSTALGNRVLVGLAGRIPVKVTGDVRAGDFITISSTPGVGMAAAAPGFVIGRAIEDAVDNRVMIIIQPTYFSPVVDGRNRLIGGSATGEYVSEQKIGVAPTKLTVERSGDAAVLQLTGEDTVVTLG